MNDIITKIPEVLGILPDNKLYRSHPKVYRFLSTIHAIYNSLITMYPVAFTIINMQNNTENYLKGQMACDIMTLVKTVFYAVIASFSLLYRNVLYPNDYLDMKTAFEEIDAILEARGIKVKKSCKWWRFIIFDIAFIVYMIYVFHVFGHEAHILYVILINWVHFNFLVEILLGWRWLELVRERLAILNRLLDTLQSKQRDTHKNYEFMVSSISLDTAGYTRRALIDLINIHKRLVRIVHIFNVFMGVSVALRSLIFIIGTLSVVLRITGGLWDDFVLAIIDTAIDGLGWCVFVYKAQHVIDEGKNSVNLSLDVTATWLEQTNKTEEEKELLAHLTQRVTTQIPQFSAARFYNIDFAAIFMIVNMTTSYVVIAVQFSQN